MKIWILILLIAVGLCEFADTDADWKKDKCEILPDCVTVNVTGTNRTEVVCGVLYDIRNTKCSDPNSDDEYTQSGSYSRLIVLRGGKYDAVRQYEDRCLCFSEEPHDQWIETEEFYPGQIITCYYDKTGSKTVYEDPRPDQDARILEIVLWCVLTPTGFCLIGVCALCLMGAVFLWWVPVIIVIVIVIVIVVVIIVVIVFCIVCVIVTFYAILTVLCLPCIIGGIGIYVCCALRDYVTGKWKDDEDDDEENPTHFSMEEKVITSSDWQSTTSDTSSSSSSSGSSNSDTSWSDTSSSTSSSE